MLGSRTAKHYDDMGAHKLIVKPMQQEDYTLMQLALQLVCRLTAFEEIPERSPRSVYTLTFSESMLRRRATAWRGGALAGAVDLSPAGPSSKLSNSSSDFLILYFVYGVVERHCI